jgi:HAMP domain-containing protein
VAGTGERLAAKSPPTWGQRTRSRLRGWLGTWRTKLLLLLLAFALAPLVAQALWDYLAARRAFENDTLEGLSGIARAKAEALDQLAVDRRTQVERIAGLLAPRAGVVMAAAAAGVVPHGPAARRPPLIDAEALPTSGPAAPSGAAAKAPAIHQSPALVQLRETLMLVRWDGRQFEELLAIDDRGRVVASTHEQHEGHDAEDLEYFRRGMAGTYAAPVFLSPITHKLTLIVATPLRDPVRRVRGVLAARLNLGSVFRVVLERTGLGDSGETVVARRDGDRAVIVAPTRFDADAALERAVRLGAENGRAIQQAVQGRRGAGRVRDYRGVDTLAAWEYVPSLGWGVVAKIDRSEALAPAVRAGLRALGLAVPLALGVLLVSLLASRALVQPLCDLREAADRISRGDLDVQLDIRSRDEVGALADSFERMVAAIKFFREHARGEDEDEVLGDVPRE